MKKCSPEKSAILRYATLELNERYIYIYITPVSMHWKREGTPPLHPSPTHSIFARGPFFPPSSRRGFCLSLPHHLISVVVTEDNLATQQKTTAILGNSGLNRISAHVSWAFPFPSYKFDRLFLYTYKSITRKEVSSIITKLSQSTTSNHYLTLTSADHHKCLSLHAYINTQRHYYF